MTQPEAEELKPCREAFEKAFPRLDLTSYGGKGYNSKRTNNHWRGFQAAWNMRDVNPDSPRAPSQLETVGDAVGYQVYNPLIKQWTMIYENIPAKIEQLKTDGFILRPVYAHPTPTQAVKGANVDELLKQAQETVKPQVMAEREAEKITPEVSTFRMSAPLESPVENEALDRLAKEADNAYCRFINLIDKKCRGFESKIANGMITMEEIKDYSIAYELLGQHRGIHHALKVFRALSKPLALSVLKKPDKGCNCGAAVCIAETCAYDTGWNAAIDAAQNHINGGK